MLVLDELRDYNWSAALNLGLFREALQRLSSPRNPAEPNNHTDSPHNTTMPQPRRIPEGEPLDTANDSPERSLGPTLDTPDQIRLDLFPEWGPMQGEFNHQRLG